MALYHAEAAPARARCYARVSTEEQAQTGYSLPAQRSLLQVCLDRQGWHCAGWYVDEGKSAKDLHRPEFQRMMSEAQPGDVILVAKLDRLTRSVRDLDHLLREFDQRGLAFQSATEQFETRTPGGRLYMGIVAVISQWEREVIADRAATGKKQKVLQGEWAGGPVPFGYLAVPAGRFKRGRELLALTPDPERAHVVREIFDRYASGAGLRALCQWLNDERRVPTLSGARWRVSSLARLLTNPLYAGFVAHGRRKAGAEALTVRGQHPPLVAEERFAAVQRLFAERKAMAPRHAAGPYPLAGVARCGVCRAPVDSVRYRRKGTYGYRCRHYANGVGCGRPGASLSGMAGPAVEAAVVAALQQVPAPADLPRLFAALDSEAPPANPLAERQRLISAIAEAERAVRRWERVFEAGNLDWEALQHKTKEHREALTVLRNQLAHLEAQPAPPPAPAPVYASSRPLAEAWAHLSAPERKALLQAFTAAFGIRILLYPDRRVELAGVP